MPHATGRQGDDPPGESHGRLALALTAFGIALTLVGFPLTKGGSWSPFIVWPLVGCAVVVAGLGVWVLMRRSNRSRTERTQRTLAEELRALAATIRTFIDEQVSVAPFDTPTGRWGRQAHRMKGWEQATVRRYRDSYRQLVLWAFDEAVRQNAATTDGRTIVLGGSFDHIKLVPDLLERAARRLERLAEGDY